MSDDPTIQQRCKIVNKHGLHIRSAAAIVALANQFDCLITIASDKAESDARDMIRLMLLEASVGKEVCISASGKNAQQAILALAELIEAGFYEQAD